MTMGQSQPPVQLTPTIAELSNLRSRTRKSGRGYAPADAEIRAAVEACSFWPHDADGSRKVASYSLPV